MDAEEFFAVSWPELVPRLRVMLTRAGAPTAERDDLVQETALRLLGMWARVDHELPIEPLARRIAMNAWRDQWRRGAREVLGDVPEQATQSDTERAALAKVEVGEVSRAIAALPATTAQVLRLAASEAESGERHVPVPAALRMARSRARRALVACLKVASAAVLATLAGFRSLTRPAPSATAVGALAAIAFVLTLAVPGQIKTPALGNPAAATPGAAADSTSRPAPSATSSRNRGPASTKASRRAPAAANSAPYYVVTVGPADVGFFADLDAAGYGLRIARPGPGSSQPVCAYGNTPTTPATPECSHP